MPAKPDLVEPDIGVVIRGLELQPEPFSGKPLGHGEGAAIPPFLGADPLGIPVIDLGRLQPLRVGAAGDLDGAPAIGGRTRALLAEGQLPIAIEREGIRLEGLRELWLAASRTGSTVRSAGA